MRLEGEWVIAEDGQDRGLFNIIMPCDEFRHTDEGRLQRNTPWQKYMFGYDHPYATSRIDGLLVRRPVSACSRAILALVKPIDHGEMEHFL
jgi:hypothetical protein